MADDPPGPPPPPEPEPPLKPTSRYTPPAPPDDDIVANIEFVPLEPGVNPGEGAKAPPPPTVTL